MPVYVEICAPCSGALSPVISGISPVTGPMTGGTPVVISGTNLTGVTGVFFGGVAASSYTVNANGTITATAPAGSTGSVNVTVTTSNGTTNLGVNGIYTYAASASGYSVVQVCQGVANQYVTYAIVPFFAANTTVGNLVVIGLLVPGPTIVTPPSPLALLYSAVGTEYTLHVYAGVITTGATTYSFGLNPYSYALAVGAELHGNSASFADQNAEGHATSTTMSAGPVTTTVASECALFFGAAIGAYTASNPTGFAFANSAQLLPDNTSLGMWLELLSATATLTPSTSLGATAEVWEAVIGTYK
jgi:large repetitive protein